MIQQKKAKRLSAWERQGLIELHEKGKTQREIALALNISTKTVNKAIQKHNAKPPKVRKPPVKKIIEEPKAPDILEIDLLRKPDESTTKTDILIAFRASLAEAMKRLPDMEDERVIGVVNRLLTELNKE